MGYKEFKIWLLIHVIGLLSFTLVVVLEWGWHRPAGPLMRAVAKIPWPQTWPSWLPSGLTLVVGIITTYAVMAVLSWLTIKSILKTWRD